MQVHGTKQVAEMLGVDDWRIRRLFEEGDLPEPTRVAGRRLVPASMIPKIEAALRKRGWLQAMTAAT